MQVTYKFRLYPKEEQEQKLLWTLDKCRFVYNCMLASLNRQREPNRLELQSKLPSLKEEQPELKNIYSKVLQYEVHLLFSNLRALAMLKKNGNKVGKLRFKGKGWFKTFVYNQSGFKVIKTGKRLDLLHLSKIGDIPIRIHREVNGETKQVIIKKQNYDKWFACFSVKNEDLPPKKIIEKAVGIDVGLRYFLTDSDGRQIENPKFYERTLERIRILHRNLSRKRKGSENREKAKMKLAKAYEKLVNRRNDFLHKLSRFYVDNYDTICVEDLSMKGMVRNHMLAGKILDASWGRFLQLLAYKAERAGVRVVKANPRGTSKEYRYGKLDRDYNASLNILGKGLLGRGQPLEPVEREPLLVEIPASSIVEAGSPLR